MIFSSGGEIRSMPLAFSIVVDPLFTEKLTDHRSITVAFVASLAVPIRERASMLASASI